MEIPQLGNDKETIKGDGVCDSGTGEEVTTQKFVFGISDVFVLSFSLLLFVPSIFFLRKFLGFLVYNFCLFLSFARSFDPSFVFFLLRISLCLSAFVFIIFLEKIWEDVRAMFQLIFVT